MLSKPGLVGALLALLLAQSSADVNAQPIEMTDKQLKVLDRSVVCSGHETTVRVDPWTQTDSVARVEIVRKNREPSLFSARQNISVVESLELQSPQHGGMRLLVFRSKKEGDSYIQFNRRTIHLNCQLF